MSKPWKIFFEVKLIYRLERFYIAELIKAYLDIKANLTNEIILNYKLISEPYSLSCDQLKNLNIPSLSNVSKFNTFLKANETLKDSEKLLPDINKIIYSYYQDLCFFNKPEEQSFLTVLTDCTIS